MLRSDWLLFALNVKQCIPCVFRKQHKVIAIDLLARNYVVCSLLNVPSELMCMAVSIIDPGWFEVLIPLTLGDHLL